MGNLPRCHVGRFRKKNRLVRAYALCEWPCLAAIVCAIVALLWQLFFAAPLLSAAATPTAPGYQRSLQELDSDCHYTQPQPRAVESCTGYCSSDGASTAAMLDIPGFDLSILTCTDSDRYQREVSLIGDDALHELAIEVVRNAHVF